LTSTAVKANKPLEYSHWDAESQCAVDANREQIETAQQEFKQQKSGTGISNVSSAATNSGIQQLLSALLQFILQLFK